MSFMSEMVTFLAETDIISLFFPWLLLLAFTYGTLRKQEFFEDEAIAGAVALSVSFLAVAGVYYFLPSGVFTDLGAIIGFAAFVSLGFLIVMAMSGLELDEKDQLKIPMGAGLIVLIIGLIGVGVNNVPSLDVGGVSAYEDVIMPIVFLLFILGVVSIAGKGD